MEENLKELKKEIFARNIANGKWYTIKAVLNNNIEPIKELNKEWCECCVLTKRMVELAEANWLSDKYAFYKLKKTDFRGEENYYKQLVKLFANPPRNFNTVREVNDYLSPFGFTLVSCFDDKRSKSINDKYWLIEKGKKFRTYLPYEGNIVQLFNDKRGFKMLCRFCCSFYGVAKFPKNQADIIKYRKKVDEACYKVLLWAKRKSNRLNNMI